MEPVFLRRSVWTASGLPVFIGQGFDLAMSECGNAMCDCSNWRMVVLVSPRGMLQGLPRILMSRQVILFSVLLASAMDVRCAVV
jgi:hypothetical protein